MNNLVEFEYDSFEKINKVTLKKNVRPKVRILKKTLMLSKLDATFLGFQENGGQSEIGIYLAFDSYVWFPSLLIKFDDSEVLTLQELRSWHNINVMASFYGCSQDILKKMCDANNVEFRAKGNEDYLDFTLDDIGLAACAMFNALIDENAYVEEIKEREAVESAREAKKSEYKANTAARLVKARKQKQQQRLQKARAGEPFKEEIAKLIKQCNSHLGSVGVFLDHGVWVSDNEEKIINRFKGWGHNSDYVELHNHFAYAIPLFESLLKHLHEYNSTNENNMKVTIYYSTFTEEKLRDFINLLKSTKKKLYPIVIKRKMVIIAGTGYPLAVIAGGIWSIINSSWTPVISLFILVSVVLIIMAIVRKN